MDSVERKKPEKEDGTNRDKHILHKIEWFRIILDESHAVGVLHANLSVNRTLTLQEGSIGYHGLLCTIIYLATEDIFQHKGNFNMQK